LLKLVQDGLVSQDEALANADSATNLLWLLNNGPDSKLAKADERKHQGPAERGLLHRVHAQYLSQAIAPPPSTSTVEPVANGVVTR
jgi:hypothetical protein